MMCNPAILSAGKSITLSFFNSATSTGASPAIMTLPASIQAGDLIVIGNWARNNIGAPALSTPSGFTVIVDQDSTPSNTRVNAWYKIAAGTEGGTNVGGTNGGVENNRWCLVFRGDVPIASVNISSLHVEQNDNAPTNQTVTAGQSPLVVIAGYRSSGNVTTRGFSPAEDAEITPSTIAFVKRKIFNGVPVNETISMADFGNVNTLFSFNIECLPA
jgi:hypothetical protein